MLAALGLPSATAAQESVEYYGLDAVGSVRVVFDASGNILGRMDYGPFGQELSNGAGLPSRAYAGLFRDGEAGLDHAEARSYQSRTGRFSTIDPVAGGIFEPQQWNRYSYTQNSPLNRIDPDGLCSRWISFGGTNSSGQSGFWTAECSTSTNPYDIYRGDGTLVSTGSSLGTISKDLAAAEGAYTALVQTAQNQLGQQSAASVSTSTEITLPNGKKVRPGESDDPFVRLAEGVFDRTKALQKPMTYVEFFALSAAGGATGSTPVWDFLFERAGQGLLNGRVTGDLIRIGYGWQGTWDTGVPVFRIALGSERLAVHIHWTLWVR